MKKVVYPFIIIIFALAVNCQAVYVFATPYYGLSPKEIVLRGEFTTAYASSPTERKHNIELCAKSLNGIIVGGGEEFSFNSAVGPRTEDNGYLCAKVIVNGEFLDGIGGGVCQVSTTLYNALLLAGVSVTECHQHSLQVGYVAPSFDAMVNYNYADLRFINSTKNPVYLKTYTNGEIIKISVYGEPIDKKFERKSVITEIVPSPEEIVFDEQLDYPELKKGERKVLSYGRNGVKSEGYLYEYDLSGNLLGIKRIRKNSYLPIKTVIVEGIIDEENGVGFNGEDCVV